MTTNSAKPDARRAEVLSAAAAVFMRYGYRKASMDDVATAAGLSRQALYLRFASKDDLFGAALEHVMASSLAEARRLLRDDHRELLPRIVAAFTALHGLHLGDAVAAQHVAELTEAAAKVVGPALLSALDPFVDDVARVLTAEKIAGPRDGPSARDLAATIDAASRGIKHTVGSRAEYEKQMARVVRVVCRLDGSNKGQKR